MADNSGTIISPILASPLLRLYLERLFRISSSLVSTVLIARYLGTSNFGELSFALSVIAISSAVASLGLNDILISKTARDPSSLKPLAGGLVLRVMSGLAVFALTLIVLQYTIDVNLQGLLFCISLVLLAPLYSFEQLLFAKSAGTKVAFVGILEIPFTLLFRLLIIFLDLGVFWIAFSFLVEAAVRLTMITIIVIKAGYLQRGMQWPSQSYLFALFRSGIPLMLSGISIILYMKLDQIMIRQFFNATEVGIYSVAVRITEAFYFIPMILTTTVLPNLSVQHEQNRAGVAFIRLYRLLFFSGLTISTGLILLGGDLVRLAFGAEYAAAGEYLGIYALSLPLVFLGVASGKWLILENLHRNVLQRSLLGLAINFTLNLALIPLYGGKGAATATVLSQLAATVLYDFISATTRPMGMQKLAAIFPGFGNRANADHR
jgi:PST family polysaccharide transporter